MSETTESNRRRSLVDMTVMASGLLLSRVLGFFRDMNTAAVMGMSGSVIMDAFVLAFRIPNEIKRLFEEGTLQLSFVPVFTPLWNQDRERAQELFWSTFAALAIVLTAIVVCGELLCLLGIWGIGQISQNPNSLYRIALELSIFLFPFLIFLPLSTLLIATLQGMERFVLVSFIPMIFNVFWLAALLLISPIGVYLPFRVESFHFLLFGFDLRQLNEVHSAAFLSLAIVAASVFQCAIQTVYLYGLGVQFRIADLTRIKKNLLALFQFPKASLLGGNARRLTEVGNNESPVAKSLYQVVRILFPSVFILFLIQLNVLLATLIAILFSGDSGSPISWLRFLPGLEGTLSYPMNIGASSSLYFSERLYEFPLGIIGLTVGTVFYPTLNRKAKRKDRTAFSSDIQWAIRFVLAISVPATVGLIFLAEPLARLLYEHGEFSAEDAFRTSRTISCFAIGVCAFCLIPMLIRCFFAVQDYRTPIRTALRSVGLFLALSAIFLWFFAERGLALAISLATWFQAIELFRQFYWKHERVKIVPILKTLGKSAIATILMGETLWLLFQQISGRGVCADLWRVGIGTTIGVAVFALSYFILENKIEPE